MNVLTVYKSLTVKNAEFLNLSKISANMIVEGRHVKSVERRDGEGRVSVNITELNSLVRSVEDREYVNIIVRNLNVENV